MKGQIGYAIMMSNYSRGAGDFDNFTSGNVNYIYNAVVSKINENTNNMIFISGHSSGGGDAQDVLWRLKQANKTVKASFQIDSVEIEFANWGDAKIPDNTQHAFNYYQSEELAWAPREASIYADNPSKTTIKNTRIYNPKCGVPCNDSPHQAMDNDPRVWRDIISKMRSYSGINTSFFE